MAHDQRDEHILYDGGNFQVREVTSTNPHLAPHQRKFIDCRPCAIIVPWSEGKVLTVVQYRDNVGRNSMEFPGGGFDEGDIDALAKAKEELLQETGYQAAHWYALTDRSQPTPFSLSRQRVHCFLVVDPILTAEPLLDPSERGLVSEWVPVDLFEDRIAAGAMTNSTNHTAWALAAIYLRRKLGIRW